MSGLNLVRFPALTITNGGTDSGNLALETVGALKTVLANLADFLVHAPATLPETVTVQVSYLEAPTSGDWTTLQEAGSDVTLVAGKATEFPISGWRALRLHSGSAVGADRVFRLSAQVAL